MTSFSPEVQTAVLSHMNGDHGDDNLLIVRAFSQAAATSAEMTGFDELGGVWTAVLADGPSEVRVPWPASPISERSEVRREIVALYDEACARLGVEPRPH